MSILRELWVGGIFLRERPVLFRDEYLEAVDKVVELESKLTAAMNDEQKALLLEYDDAVSAMDAVCDESTFVTGFRMGARIMLEVLQG